MPHKLDIEIDLTPRTTSRYILSSQHRRKGNPDKCVWTITKDEEIECFIQSKISDWKSDLTCWGLKFSGNILDIVGQNYQCENLKIAKFVDGTGTDVWHGYPADYLKRKQDIPKTLILQTWVINGYTGKSDFRKIRQGMPCNL